MPAMKMMTKKIEVRARGIGSLAFVGSGFSRRTDAGIEVFSPVSDDNFEGSSLDGVLEVTMLLGCRHR
jgi:hypothetical protein